LLRIAYYGKCYQQQECKDYFFHFRLDWYLPKR
jgi:hypothetical protein